MGKDSPSFFVSQQVVCRERRWSLLYDIQLKIYKGFLGRVREGHASAVWMVPLRVCSCTSNEDPRFPSAAERGKDRRCLVAKVRKEAVSAPAQCPPVMVVKVHPGQRKGATAHAGENGALSHKRVTADAQTRVLSNPRTPTHSGPIPLLQPVATSHTHSCVPSASPESCESLRLRDSLCPLPCPPEPLSLTLLFLVDSLRPLLH